MEDAQRQEQNSIEKEEDRSGQVDSIDGFKLQIALTTLKERSFQLTPYTKSQRDDAV